MDFATLWFVLIGVLFTGFFILEGFDYGVGILLPFLGKDDAERRRIINTIGPFWDANEVWVLTAGGATFAAFPHWYATMFSGFYLALFLLLTALILRGVAFEFRSKDSHPGWRATWDWMAFLGSALPALLWGVAFANLIKGVPIDADKQFVGSLLDLLSPYTLIAGLATLAVFTVHGAVFLNLKSTEPLRDRARGAARRLGPVALGLGLLLAAVTPLWTDALQRQGVWPALPSIGALGTLAAAVGLIARGRMGWAFALTSGAIALGTVSLFAALYPRVMVSSLDPAWSLTVENASSSPYTLRIMSLVALVFVPVVLAYQGWTYWVFRQRVGADSRLEY